MSRRDKLALLAKWVLVVWVPATALLYALTPAPPYRVLVHPRRHEVAVVVKGPAWYSVTVLDNDGAVDEWMRE